MKFMIPIDIFNLSVHFFIGEEMKKPFLKATGKDEKDLYDCDGYTSCNAIWIENANNIDVIVHEIHHAKKFIVESRGIKDEETEAYLMSYILKGIMKKIQHANKKAEKGKHEQSK